MVSLPEDMRPQLRGAPLWRTPLIPLPAALLYPGRRLPLHLRDDRFRLLLDDAAAGDGLVSVATMLPELEGRDGGRDPAGEDPFLRPVYGVVGVGRVVETIPSPEGVQVTFEGISRARLVAEERCHHYRVGLVNPLDEGGMAGEIEEELAHLLREVGDLGPLVRRSGSPLSPGHLADLINAHLPQPVGVKQEVFEILDVARRLRNVRRLLREVRRNRAS